MAATQRSPGKPGTETFRMGFGCPRRTTPSPSSTLMNRAYRTFSVRCCPSPEANNTTVRMLTRRGFGYHSADALIAITMLKRSGLRRRPPRPLTPTGPSSYHSSRLTPEWITADPRKQQWSRRHEVAAGLPGFLVLGSWVGLNGAAGQQRCGSAVALSGVRKTATRCLPPGHRPAAARLFHADRGPHVHLAVSVRSRPAQCLAEIVAEDVRPALLLWREHYPEDMSSPVASGPPHSES